MSKICLALDTTDLETVKSLCNLLKDKVDMFKVGLELFTAYGPNVIKILHDQGINNIFLDLKLNDIPETVAKTVKVINSFGVSITSLHISGGPEMIKRSVECVKEHSDKFNITPTKLIGITVLTSLIDTKTSYVVTKLAEEAKEYGLDGVVCSPVEVNRLRQVCGDDFILVTPGIRPTWTVVGDQPRHGTPFQAAEDGSDYLVIGRPITLAKDPVHATERILDEITF